MTHNMTHKYTTQIETKTTALWSKAPAAAWGNSAKPPNPGPSQAFASHLNTQMIIILAARSECHLLSAPTPQESPFNIKRTNTSSQSCAQPSNRRTTPSSRPNLTRLEWTTRTSLTPMKSNWWPQTTRSGRDKMLYSTRVRYKAMANSTVSQLPVRRRTHMRRRLGRGAIVEPRSNMQRSRYLQGIVPLESNLGQSTESAPRSKCRS